MKRQCENRFPEKRKHGMLFRVLTGRKVRIYIWIYRKAHRRSAWKFCKDIKVYKKIAVQDGYFLY